MSKERYGDPTTPLEDIFTLPLAYQDIEGRFGVKNQGLPSGVSGEGLGSKIPGYVEILERKKLKHQKFQISKMFRTTSRNTLGMRARPPPAPARLVRRSTGSLASKSCARSQSARMKATLSEETDVRSGRVLYVLIF